MNVLPAARWVAVIIFAGVILEGGAALGEDSLSPRSGWRMNPEAIAASDGTAQLKGLTSGKSVMWRPDGQEAWFAVKLPEHADRRAMLVLGAPEQSRGLEACAAVSKDSTDGIDGTWEEIGKRPLSWRMAKFEAASGAVWLKVTVTGPEGGRIRCENVGLYELKAGERHDYWLFVGASILQQSMRQSTFSWMAREYNGECDPVIFNTAVGGWETSDVLEALPGFLEEHPYATYVCIHIGGNNISQNRPWPGAADEIREQLEEILTIVTESGRIPVLARLSYRAYKDRETGGLAGEDAGSGPYVAQIYDPLIEKYCPEFFDKENGRGVVDAYNWFKAHPGELLPDGVHVNDKGVLSWNRLWARDAGAVIYGR